MSDVTSTTKQNESKETDLLRYQGNGIPRLIRFLWTVMFIFGLIYLGRFMWPDLHEWLERLK